MELQDNKYITDPVVNLLLDDDWTIETLATAQPATLERYKGIGKVTARAIIYTAKKMVNQIKLDEAAQFVIPETPQPEEEPPQMSARVRRIQEQNQ